MYDQVQDSANPGGNMLYEGATETKAPTQPTGLDRYDYALDALGEAVMVLTDRLNPVLKPDDNEVAGPRAVNPEYNRLQEMNSRLEEMTRKLRYLAGRVDL